MVSLLQVLFEEFGPIYQINVLRDKISGQSKGRIMTYVNCWGFRHSQGFEDKNLGSSPGLLWQ